MGKLVPLRPLHKVDKTWMDRWYRLTGRRPADDISERVIHFKVMKKRNKKEKIVECCKHGFPVNTLRCPDCRLQRESRVQLIAEEMGE